MFSFWMYMYIITAGLLPQCGRREQFNEVLPLLTFSQSLAPVPSVTSSSTLGWCLPSFRRHWQWDSLLANGVSMNSLGLRTGKAKHPLNTLAAPSTRLLLVSYVGKAGKSLRDQPTRYDTNTLTQTYARARVHSVRRVRLLCPHHLGAYWVLLRMKKRAQWNNEKEKYRGSERFKSFTILKCQWICDSR